MRGYGCLLGLWLMVMVGWRGVRWGGDGAREGVGWEGGEGGPIYAHESALSASPFPTRNCHTRSLLAPRVKQDAAHPQSIHTLRASDVYGPQTAISTNDIRCIKLFYAVYV